MLNEYIYQTMNHYSFMMNSYVGPILMQYFIGRMNSFNVFTYVWFAEAKLLQHNNLMGVYLF